MAGGVLKGFGVTFLILGALLVVAGLAAAGFGAYMLNEQDDRGLFADPDKAEGGETLLVAGGVAAGAGVLLLVLGGIFTAVGGAMARRALMRAIQTGAPAAPVPPPAPVSAPGKVVAAVVVAAVLVAAGAIFLLDAQNGAFVGTASTPAPIATTQTFDGYVQGGRLILAGGLNTGASDAIHELSLPSGPTAVSAVTNWTQDSPTSAASLVVILEVEQSGGWQELARGEGGPGFEVPAPQVDVLSKVRARVFVGGNGAADQAYVLTLTATPVA